ncbi:MAG: MarR family transcriptional regulator [Tardiphaga sp.]|uniref:bifunctional helix-turn-helix transcriptional regulator/GNAT family N-acetyltransferase n=1 Tax=Tardiphaga sp. TaxID=1926292 RepID=UPI002604612C|nr:helix-turn-helix domain-containing GNAT family N-acetyltransferase [Tardiphaga sp.]MDB5502957.1 MarR family transcriptional regulator [Tardiphaga sp.]
MTIDVAPPPMPKNAIAAVRAFNRFYTRKLGVLEPNLLDSPYSLTEARVLYELAHRDDLSAKAIATDLGLNPGYLSRIVQNFHDKGLITRTVSKEDRRQYRLGLTAKGRLAFGRLNRSSHDNVAALLAELPFADHTRVVQAMATIRRLLDPAESRPRVVTLRQHRPGDIGWVIARHGAVYAEEYGWDSSFEALVAEIAAKFIRNYDAARECCLIAETDGAPAGSIFLVKASDDVAQIRMLVVERHARGLGVGRALVEQAIRFARQVGYRSITLSTHSILVAARGIYQRAGFELVASEPHHSFGADLVAETWEMKL